MHFEILVEDQSGKKALDILVPKIIGPTDTFIVHPYKGIGRIPANLHSTKDPAKRILLDQLPRLLQGYGKTFWNFPGEYQAAVIVVCDLDDNCLKAFKKQLLSLLDNCNPQPDTRFCIAIEEGEAWFLGDINAVIQAYPDCRKKVLKDYVNDSICGTWERLADAVYPGGSQALSKQGFHKIGHQKTLWAENIACHMDVDNNNSQSFCYFRDNIQDLCNK